MTKEEFIANCEKGICSRNTFQSKNCKKRYRQEQCWRRYLKSIEKDEEKKGKIDYEWEEVRSYVFARDNNSCQLWNLLNKKEKAYILDNYREEYSFLSKTLDPAHIISRARSKELYYDPENIVTISRYFHTLLDQLKHPITQLPMTDDERFYWLISARKGERR